MLLMPISPSPSTVAPKSGKAAEEVVLNSALYHTVVKRRSIISLMSRRTKERRLERNGSTIGGNTKGNRDNVRKV